MTAKYVLVVDDQPDVVETVSLMLESKGLEVGKAYDGVEAEEAIRERRPDLVVLDVMMPRKSGFQLCAQLKDDDDTVDIPVILLTAVGDEVTSSTYSHLDGMATEANDYVPKPIDTATLWEAVQRWL